MYTYNMTQWCAFFIIYCFLGWVWESCYVSVRQKKWVNRGFMHGPLLPIYGSGAVIVLFAALPFKGNVIAVYIAGMLSATVLEYCTGAAMEAIFKVRYWDYSQNKFNLNGHICLFCSLGWGLFSIAMVYCLHHPFERIVLALPDAVLSPILYLVMMIAAADFAISFKTAIELRDVLVKLEKAKYEAKLMQRRIEIYETFLADDAMQRIEKYEEEIRELGEDLKGFVEELKEKAEAVKETGEDKKNLLKMQIHEEKKDLELKLHTLHNKLSERSYFKRDYARLLDRNPGAISMHYKNAFEELKLGVREKVEEIKQKK